MNYKFKVNKFGKFSPFSSCFLCHKSKKCHKRIFINKFSLTVMKILYLPAGLHRPIWGMILLKKWVFRDDLDIKIQREKFWFVLSLSFGKRCKIKPAVTKKFHAAYWLTLHGTFEVVTEAHHFPFRLAQSSHPSDSVCKLQMKTQKGGRKKAVTKQWINCHNSILIKIWSMGFV